MKSRNCINCGKEILPVFPDDMDTNPEESAWNDGIVDKISAGYGSHYDGDTFIIAICDECIKNNLDKLIE